MLDNRNAGTGCWPLYECQWEECMDEEFYGEDSCWKEYCYDVN